MADISNKTLAVFLLVAMVVSMWTVFSGVQSLDRISGRAATDTGTANFSINSSISVVFTTSNADFGLGQVNGSGSHDCTLNTSITNGIPNADCWGFNDVVPGLVIQNQGTLNVTLNISVNSTAAQFIGGSSPSLTWEFSNNESGSCAGIVTTKTEVADADNVTICPTTQFDWQTGSRTLNMDIGVKIPQDTTPGARTVLIIAHAANP